MPPQTSSAHWDDRFSGSDFFYGLEPGPVARRAEKYHRSLRALSSSALSSSALSSSALDQGCGEGQDLAFLAACGYQCTGLDFSMHARRKARSLLGEQNLQAQVLEADLSLWQPERTWDLVLSINVLPFVGERADFALAQALHAVAAGGVLGLSVWAREDARSPALAEGVRLWAREEIEAALEESGTWQRLEVALLQQYFSGEGGVPCLRARPFVTVVAQRLK